MSVEQGVQVPIISKVRWQFELRAAVRSRAISLKAYNLDAARRDTDKIDALIDQGVALGYLRGSSDGE